MCSSFKIDLWAAVLGLQLAWPCGFKKLILETDCKVLVDATNKVSSSFIHDPLFKEVMSFLKRDWEIYTSHTYKEGNQCVDWLANQALSMEIGTHYFDSLPVGMSNLLFQDIIGVAIPRLVCI